jgi:hypothetical protein
MAEPGGSTDEVGGGVSWDKRDSYWFAALIVCAVIIGALLGLLGAIGMLEPVP